MGPDPGDNVTIAQSLWGEVPGDMIVEGTVAMTMSATDERLHLVAEAADGQVREFTATSEDLEE